MHIFNQISRYNMTEHAKVRPHAKVVIQHLLEKMVKTALYSIPF